MAKLLEQRYGKAQVRVLKILRDGPVHNHELDREALATALQIHGAGYIGMIGSQRKVRQVFAQLRERGVPEDALAKVYAPIGLDIGADSPAEIAVNVMAEILSTLRKASAQNLRVVSGEVERLSDYEKMTTLSC